MFHFPWKFELLVLLAACSITVRGMLGAGVDCSLKKRYDHVATTIDCFTDAFVYASDGSENGRELTEQHHSIPLAQTMNNNLFEADFQRMVETIPVLKKANLSDIRAIAALYSKYHGSANNCIVQPASMVDFIYNYFYVFYWQPKYPHATYCDAHAQYLGTLNFLRVSSNDYTCKDILFILMKSVYFSENGSPSDTAKNDLIRIFYHFLSATSDTFHDTRDSLSLSNTSCSCLKEKYLILNILELKILTDTLTTAGKRGAYELRPGLLFTDIVAFELIKYIKVLGVRIFGTESKILNFPLAKYSIMTYLSPLLEIYDSVSDDLLRGFLQQNLDICQALVISARKPKYVPQQKLIVIVKLLAFFQCSPNVFMKTYFTKNMIEAVKNPAVDNPKRGKMPASKGTVNSRQAKGKKKASDADINLPDLALFKSEYSGRMKLSDLLESENI